MFLVKPMHTVLLCKASKFEHQCQSFTPTLARAKTALEAMHSACGRERISCYSMVDTIQPFLTVTSIIMTQRV